MKTIVKDLDKDLSKENRRDLSFISNEIMSYEIQGKQIILYVADNANEEVIEDNMKKCLNKKVTKPKRVVSRQNRKSYISDEEMFNSGIVERYEEGSVLFNKKGIQLCEFFDKCFISLLNNYDVNFRKYPTLISKETLVDTGYHKMSPQYLIFCSEVVEDIDKYKKIDNKLNDIMKMDLLSEPKFALSPSACFALYPKLRNKILDKNEIYTMRQNVFRNEGRFGWSEVSRLRDYNVREIVFIGDNEFIHKVRKDILDKTIELMDKIGLDFVLDIATDPFVLPDLQNYRRIQKRNQTKYELRLFDDIETTIACASFNLHGTSFSKKFEFSVKNIKVTESGCIGFGIERFVIAFLKQYGTNEGKWPEIVRKNL